MDDTPNQTKQDSVEEPLAPVEEIPASITAEPEPDDGLTAPDSGDVTCANSRPRSYRYTVTIRGRAVSESYVNVDELVINPGGQPVVRRIGLQFTKPDSTSQEGRGPVHNVPAGEKWFVTLIAHGKKGSESNAVVARVELQG